MRGIPQHSDGVLRTSSVVNVGQHGFQRFKGYFRTGRLFLGDRKVYSPRLSKLLALESIPFRHPSARLLATSFLPAALWTIDCEGCLPSCKMTHLSQRWSMEVHPMPRSCSPPHRNTSTRYALSRFYLSHSHSQKHCVPRNREFGSSADEIDHTRILLAIRRWQDNGFRSGHRAFIPSSTLLSLVVRTGTLTFDIVGEKLWSDRYLSREMGEP